MNKARRTALKAVIASFEELERLRHEIQERLEEIMDEEQASLDNLPESLQESDRGQQIQECIDTIDGIVDELDAMDLDGMTDQLREIAWEG